MCDKKDESHVGFYTKYQDNLQAKKKLLEKNAIFAWVEEKVLLIFELDEKEFDKFVKELTVYLKELVKKLEEQSLSRHILQRCHNLHQRIVF